MAAIVASDCEDCGQHVQVPALEVTLAIWRDNPGLSTYSFKCPNCGRIQTRSAAGMKQSLLVMGGVPAKVMELPAHDAPEGAPTLTSDDLLDLCWSLRDTDTPEELLEGEEG